VACSRRQAGRLGGGALRPSAWDARLPALSPWRFWAGRARFPHRTCVRIGQRAPRTRGVVPEGEVSSPRGERLRAAAAGRHASLSPQDRL